MGNAQAKGSTNGGEGRFGVVPAAMSPEPLDELAPPPVLPMSPLQSPADGDGELDASMTLDTSFRDSGGTSGASGTMNLVSSPIASSPPRPGSTSAGTAGFVVAAPAPAPAPVPTLSLQGHRSAVDSNAAGAQSLPPLTSRRSAPPLTARRGSGTRPGAGAAATGALHSVRTGNGSGQGSSSGAGANQHMKRLRLAIPNSPFDQAPGGKAARTRTNVDAGTSVPAAASAPTAAASAATAPAPAGAPAAAKPPARAAGKPVGLSISLDSPQGGFPGSAMTARREGFSLNLAAAQDLTRIDNVDVDVDGILITEQHRKEFKLAHQATVVSSVTPSLCVGGQLVASDRSKMKQAGITTIVNAAGDVAPASFSGEPWVSYLTMFLYDSPKQSIADQFPLLVKIVQETERHGGRTFVHCSQGVSRSGALVIAHIMWAKQLTFDAAYAEARKKRPTISPNPGFICQLLEWEQLLRLVRDTPAVALLYRVMSLRRPSVATGAVAQWFSDSPATTTCEWKYSVCLARTKGDRELVRPSRSSCTDKDCAIVRCGGVAFICVGPLCEDAEAKVRTCRKEIQCWEELWGTRFTVKRCTIGREPPQLIEALVLGAAVDISTPMATSTPALHRFPSKDSGDVRSPSKVDHIQPAAATARSPAAATRTVPPVAAPATTTSAGGSAGNGGAGAGAGGAAGAGAGSGVAESSVDINLTSIVPGSDAAAAAATQRANDGELTMFERLAGTRFVGDADSSVPPALRRGAEDESANVVVKKPRLLQSVSLDSFEDLGVFDEDDLEDGGLFVLLPHASTPGHKFTVYAWRSDDYTHPDGTTHATAKEYAEAAARAYAKIHLPDGDPREVVVVHEEQGEESDGFWDLFES